MQRLASIYIDVPALRPGTVGAYAVAFLCAGIATTLRLAIDPYVVGAQFITFYPAVIVTTLISGFNAGVFCTVVSAAAVNFFVIDPRLSFHIDHPGEVVAVLLFALVSLMNVILVTGLRYAVQRNRELSKRLEQHSLSLRERPDDASRLQKIVQDSNVDALFERMWLASIVAFSEDAVVSKNVDGIITSWNKGAERLFGYLAEEAIGKPVTILIPSERQHEEDVILERIRRGDRIEHFETVRQRKDGSPINVSLTISPIKTADGKVVGASKIARDITDRKRSEAQISVLAREAEHRAKNLLANVKAMVRLSQADSIDGLKEAIEGRIEALANVHSLFARSRWAGAELATLVKQELSPYSRDGEVRTQIDGPAIMLKPDLAQAIAVTLHELATNAVKYGALSAATGQVRVEWSRAEDGRLVLRWTEAGGPLVNPPTRRGFGTHVMEAMIRGHAKGDVRLDWHAEGLACEISLPSDVACSSPRSPWAARDGEGRSGSRGLTAVADEHQGSPQ
jgi:PAS domain S-box-containing protein